MRAYLWTMFILGVLDVFGLALLLAKNEYPRMKTRAYDAAQIVAASALLVWVAVLLFGNW